MLSLYQNAINYVLLFENHNQDIAIQSVVEKDILGIYYNYMGCNYSILKLVHI